MLPSLYQQLPATTSNYQQLPATTSNYGVYKHLQSESQSLVLYQFTTQSLPAYYKSLQPSTGLLMLQSAKRAIAFHTTGVMCKPLRPAADFSKANWGDHVKFNAHGCPTHVYPTSILTALVKQLKPKQWEKILSAAVEESMLKTDEFASTSTSVDTRPTPQLRDDDSDLE
ncbi:hypothetical protein EDB84DRAFT_1569867 [Lactarius hengduanensis]|nr:hypothetical protein EDB84DRAFT_1569867 [Lactarius hengduanensis]